MTARFETEPKKIEHGSRCETYNSKPEQYMKCCPPVVSVQKNVRFYKSRSQSRKRPSVYCVHATSASVSFAHELVHASGEDETGRTAFSAADCSWILTHHSVHVASVGAGMGAHELDLEESAMIVVSQIKSSKIRHTYLLASTRYPKNTQSEPAGYRCSLARYFPCS